MPDSKQQLREAFERLLAEHTDGGSPNGPIADPPDRFAQLPEHVRKFIAGLGEEDCADWTVAIRWFRSVRVVLRFFKSLGVAVGGAFATTAAAAAVATYKYFKGG